MKKALISLRKGQNPVPIVAVRPTGRRTMGTLAATHTGLKAAWISRWLQACNFDASPGSCALLPHADGHLAAVLFGLGDEQESGDAFIGGKLARLLPPERYRLANAEDFSPHTPLAFALDAYRFDPYLASPKASKVPQLCLAAGEIRQLMPIIEATSQVRDMINTPAIDFGPEQLEQAARALASGHGAAITVTRGKSLQRRFPLVHAVGMASSRSPRLIDLCWGPEGAPRLTLVGKGVCFDTGGLNIKPGNSMLTMKKDMGGGAHVLGLAQLIMGAGLKVRLRVIIPAVENSIAGNAYRPGDILPSRKGLHVEIGNTDAEGRLILADALALADEEKPELLIDMATLTGAARVAVGYEIAPFYCDDACLVEPLMAAARKTADPLWQLPLWDGYAALLQSKIADIHHISTSPFGGSIIAALFLRRFVEHAGAWMHFDISAFNLRDRPGRPRGGEAQGLRALFSFLSERYGYSKAAA